jgi:peptide/nickel transport system permease protein
MKSYLIRRLLYMVPIVLGVCVITFVLFRVLMGDPTLSLVGKGARKQEIREVRRANGYDRPLLLDLEALSDRRAVIRDNTEGRESFTITPSEENDFTDALYLHRIVETGKPDVFLSEDFPDLSRDTSTEWIASRAPFPGFGKPAEESQKETIRFSLVLRDGTRTEVDASGASTLGEVLDQLASDANLKGKIEFAIVDAGKSFWDIFDSQFVFHFSHLLRFDLGKSHQYRKPIASLLKEGVGASLRLTVPMFFIGLYLQVLIALYCAFKRGTGTDYVIVIVSVIGMSLPYLAVIAYAQLFFCYKLPIFPIVYRSAEPLRSYLLPIFIGVVSGVGGGVRFYRTVFLDEIGADYVRTARAKGVSEGGVLWKHVFRNAMIPVLTQVVIVIPFLFLGSLLLERYFGIPGLGGMMVTAINNSDIPIINAMTYVGALLFSVGVLATDVCYALVDPRISFK